MLVCMYDSTRIEKTANKMPNFKPFSPSPYVHTYICIKEKSSEGVGEGGVGGETDFPSRIHQSIATRPITEPYPIYCTYIHVQVQVAPPPPAELVIHTDTISNIHIVVLVCFLSPPSLLMKFFLFFSKIGFAAKLVSNRGVSRCLCILLTIY